jgi:CO/xanthine dehydrogenase Mo-binding subunit
MAAITNAIEQAIGIRFNELPMSPPKVLAAIDASKGPLADAAE